MVSIKNKIAITLELYIDRESKYWQNKGRNSSTIIVWDFNTLISIMNRKIKKEINKDIEDINILNKLDINIGIFHLTITEYTFFSNAQDKPYGRSQKQALII